jgi:hypothetical protein
MFQEWKEIIMRTQLLCTFTTKQKLNEVVDIVVTCNDVLYEKIYVFQNINELNQLICTYNVEHQPDYQENIIDTISLHRKKQSNTLYTINALNEVIREKNDGVLDKSYMVDWLEFENTLLLTNEMGLQKIPTKIFQIIDTSVWGKK